MTKITAEIGDVPSINISMGNVTIVSPDATQYKGEYEVTPKVSEETILPTAGKVLEKDVRVREIPISEVSNESGNTLVIG